ncbi:MAG: glycosyltransferase family 2 protein [Alphaproteobacteria bacterium]|nr:glycosyltransferase family 2 protein [Alphaproteobacteria bacterium]MBU1512944.1 glycosyltransferase family 2 protein [Alphaproteobacteria bacterium]MBU2094882.1 glycosyltransferase family 2 protein [Alphaproteobacteria bacterium]MBU2152788.1 glycosyltransferase family 2 protein [Alphaproteobacteria bacterium]MBU2306303.1 glycosyltransferase family 2 protein [Alphaproteobacteria bacterium]
MHVAVAIVGYRNLDDIVTCLSTLERLEHTRFEVVICENGGAEAYEALVRTLPTVLAGGQAVTVIAAPRNLGYAGGVNFAIEAAPEADVWWVLNPDTEPQPGLLTACLARLAKGDCHAVGCTIYLPSGEVQSHGGRWRSWLARAVSIGWGDRVEAPVDAAAVEASQNYLNGACLLVDRTFMEVVGPMREDYFLYCEEVEWCLRAQARGVRLGFASDGRCLHHAGTTTGSHRSWRDRPKAPIYLDERNKILVTRDCFPARLPVTIPAALALIVLRFVPRRAWKQLGYALEGWWAGVRNLRGPAAFG